VFGSQVLNNCHSGYCVRCLPDLYGFFSVSTTYKSHNANNFIACCTHIFIRILASRLDRECVTGDDSACHFNVTVRLNFLFSFHSHLTILQIGIHINTNISHTCNQNTRCNYVTALMMADKALVI
jgi:hypothetical protein